MHFHLECQYHVPSISYWLIWTNCEKYVCSDIYYFNMFLFCFVFLLLCIGHNDWNIKTKRVVASSRSTRYGNQLTFHVLIPVHHYTFSFSLSHSFISFTRCDFQKHYARIVNVLCVHENMINSKRVAKNKSNCIKHSIAGATEKEKEEERKKEKVTCNCNDQEKWWMVIIWFTIDVLDSRWKNFASQNAFGVHQPILCTRSDYREINRMDPDRLHRIQTLFECNFDVHLNWMRMKRMHAFCSFPLQCTYDQCFLLVCHF